MICLGSLAVGCAVYNRWQDFRRDMMLIEECEGSDDKDGDGGYPSGMDGDIYMAGATDG
jgi:hypothetical protein